MATQKCTRETADALIRHFSGAPYSESIDTAWHSNGEVRQESLRRIANPLPTFEGFATKIGVCVRTLAQWEEAHAYFREACERARDMQRDFLVQNALLGLCDASFARMVASAVCGLQDSQHLTLETAATIVDDLHAPDDE